MTGGGSTYPDVVADALREPWSTARPVRVVLRSGAYITHDHGVYERGSPFGMRAARGAPRLEPAIESGHGPLRPGTRARDRRGRATDLPVDQDLPVVIKVRDTSGPVRAPPSPGSRRHEAQRPARVHRARGRRARVEVGDLVAFGISHPCTAFQLWREALVVDADDRITDVYELRF